MPERVAGRTWAPLGGVLLVALATRVWFLAGPQLDYDEGVYWQSLRALAAGHPLFSSVYSSQPPGFLLLLTPFYAILGHSLPGARAGVALLSVLGIGAAYLAVSRLADVTTGLAAAALLVADPLYLRQSVTLQADGPALGLALTAIALATLVAGRTGRARLLLAAAAGMVLALGCSVKLLALPAVLPLAVLLGRDRASLAAALTGGLAGLALVLLPFVDRLDLVWRQSIGLHLGSGASGLTDAASLWAVARWETPLLALTVVSVVRSRTSPTRIVATAWLLSTAGALALVHPLWPHHLVAVVVPMVVVAAPAAASAFRRSLALASAATAGFTALAVLILLLQQSPVAHTEPALIARLTAPGDTVITDDQFAAAKAGRDTPPELVDTSFVRVRSGELRLADITRLAERDHVRLLVLGSGRLEQVPGFVDWAASHYPRREVAGSVTYFEAP